MKRKLEHLAAKMAFDELDAPQAEKLQRLTETDAEAERAVREYASMRADLKRLAHRTPQPTLSAERLRDAILRDGLERRGKVGQGLSWAWAPVATGLLAFAVVSMLHRGALRQSVVYPGPSVASAMGKDALEMPTAPAAYPAMRESPKPKQRLRTGRVVRHSAPQPAYVADLRIINVMPFLVPQLDSVRARDAQYTRVARDLTSGTDKTVVGTLATTGKPNEPHGGVKAAGKTDIVVIHPETDGQTGAQRATEVESVANVLIGG